MTFLKYGFLLFITSFLFIESFILFQISDIKNTDIEKDFDYIIVLGEKLNNNEMSDISIDRLKKSFDIYKINKNSKIIVSGGVIKPNTISEAEIMGSYLESLGIPKKDIILENKARSTFENIKFSKKIMEKDKKVALITSDFHISRAFMICNNMNLNVTPYFSNVPTIKKIQRLFGEYPRFIVDFIRSNL